MAVEVNINDNTHGIPVLFLHNLEIRHLTKLREVLWKNGDDPIHLARSEARAHLDEWRPDDRLVTVAIYGEDVWEFIRRLGVYCGIPEVQYYYDMCYPDEARES